MVALSARRRFSVRNSQQIDLIYYSFGHARRVSHLCHGWFSHAADGCCEKNVRDACCDDVGQREPVQDQGKVHRDGARP